MRFNPNKSFHIILLWLMLCLEESCGDEVCPKYCRCYMWTIPSGEMRRADCINRKLFNIETEVPQNVQALDLSNNSIAVLENNGFKNLGFLQLKYLNVKFNKISTVGLHAFAGLNDLQMIDLSDNHLHYLLPGTFHDTPALRALYLSHNKLGRSHSGAFLSIPELTELDMSRCQLGTIPEEYFSQLQSLKKLNLSDNQLIRVDVNTFSRLTSLREVDLSNNPWSCDGITTKLQLWLQKRFISDTTTCTNNDEKSAKIITAVVDTNRTEMESLDEDISHVWFNTDDKENGKDETKKTLTVNDEDYSEYISSVMERIPSVWAMVIGFQVGIVITIFAMYIWLKCPAVSKARPDSARRPRSLRISSHNNEILWTELESDMPSCPETPPPPYHPYRTTTYQL